MDIPIKPNQQHLATALVQQTSLNTIEGVREALKFVADSNDELRIGGACIIAPPAPDRGKRDFVVSLSTGEHFIIRGVVLTHPEPHHVDALLEFGALRRPSIDAAMKKDAEAHEELVNPAPSKETVDKAAALLGIDPGLVTSMLDLRNMLGGKP